MRSSPPMFVGSLRQMFAMDWRTVVMLRAALGCCVLFDSRSRVLEACDHFADDSVFPRSAILPQQYDAWVVNVFLASGACWFARAVMIAYVLAGICIVVGFRPRIAAFSAWVVTSSMQNRNPWVHDGGDLYLRSLLLWIAFLPLGDHGSLDNWMRRDYAMSFNSAAALARRLAGGDAGPARGACACTLARPFDDDASASADEGGPAPRPTSYCSAATAAVLLQVVILYVETYLEKTGDEWVWEDSALYYALSLDQFALPAARVLLRFPPLVLALSRFALLLEGYAGPLLLVLDGGWRCIAIAAVALFHWGTSVTLYLGPFPFTCMAAALAFTPRSSWQWLEATLASSPRGRAATRILLAESVLPSSTTARAATFCARALALGSGGMAAARPLFAAELPPLDARLLAAREVAQLLWLCPLLAPFGIGPGRGRDPDGPAATAAGAQPGGPCGGEGRQSAATEPREEAAGADNDTAASVHTLAACADVVQHAAPAASAPLRRAMAKAAELGQAEGGPAATAWAALSLARARRPRSRAHRWAAGAGTSAASLACAAFLSYTLWWCTVQLQEIPPPHKYWSFGLPPPTHRKLFVELLGLNQRWNMFSPSPSRYDGWYVIEANTATNRTVDLWPVIFTGADGEDAVSAPTWEAPKFAAHHYPSTKYFGNYFLPQMAEARSHLGGWLCRRFPFVRFLRIVFVTSYNRSYRLRSTPTRFSTWNHYCVEDVREEWEEHNRQNDARFVFTLPDNETINPIPFADALAGAPFPEAARAPEVEPAPFPGTEPAEEDLLGSAPSADWWPEESLFPEDDEAEPEGTVPEDDPGARTLPEAAEALAAAWHEESLSPEVDRVAREGALPDEAEPDPSSTPQTE